MNIQQLRYYEEVCRCGSLSKAAQNLYISQQGVSMSIQRLETEFSCRLLKRSTKGIYPTKEGEFLLERARVILAEVDKCNAYFSEQDPTSRELKIASSYGALSEFAANTIQRFGEENPHIQMEVTEYVDRYCDEAVLSEQVELGLSVGPIDETKFDATPLFKRRLCLVVNKNNPLACQKTISVDDLHNLNMITVNDDFKPPNSFLECCRDFGVKPNVSIKVGEVIAVHRLVAANDTYAGLSVESVASAIPNPAVVAVPFENSCFNWSVYLIKKKGAALMPAAQLFEDFITAQCHM